MNYGAFAARSQVTLWKNIAKIKEHLEAGKTAHEAVSAAYPDWSPGEVQAYV